MLGKIFGAVAGFMVGGPFGAMTGAALGHAADQGALRGGFGLLPGPADLAGLLGNREALFGISVVVLSAKLAKCDGPVKRAEIDAFKRGFRIPPEHLRQVAELFDDARDSATGWEPFAERLGTAFADNRAMLEDVLAALFQLARADGPVNRAELAFLHGVHARLGLDAAAWQRAGEGRRAAPEPDGPDAYAVLGVGRGATDAELRAAWRQLMRDNHPDGLASRGVPAEFVQRATRKVAEINAAWDRVKRERGL